MIIFLILVAIVIGINFKYSIVLCLIISVLLIVFFLLRFTKKIKVLMPIIFISLGVGLSFAKIDINQSSYKSIVVETNANYVIVMSKLERLYYYEKDNTYEVGDILTINGYKNEITSSVIESGFDFKTYLEKKGVNYQLFAKSIEVNFKNPIRIKQLRANFLSHFNSETASLINSVLFGKRDGSEILININTLHLSKLMSSSGFYLHVFNSFIIFVFSLFFKRKTSQIISMSLLGIYGIFTFPKFSVIRYMFLLIFRFINKNKFNSRIDFFSMIGISGLVFLLIDYHLAYTDAFILGFLTPVVIYFIGKTLKRYKKPIRKIGQIGLLMLFFVPFEIKFFNELNILSYPLQFVLTPLFVLFGISSLLCFFRIPIYGVSEFLTYLIKNVTSNFARFSICIYYPEFNDVFILIYNGLYFSILYYLDILLKPMLKLTVVSLLSFLTLYSFPINNLLTAEVDFINVGQGDSCLIRKGNTTVMIDTGGNVSTDIALNCLIPFLKKERIYNIDVLITTHNDYDHAGAKDNLMKYFNVKNYIFSSNLFPITINGIVINNYNTYSTDDNDNNLSSLVLGFHLINFDFLIMGDAPIEIENKIVDDNPSLKCDILKVGHHGSKTSTGQKLIDFLNPHEAVISVGRNNYGHPDSGIISLLLSRGINVRRTDKEGTIKYKNYFWT